MVGLKTGRPFSIVRCEADTRHGARFEPIIAADPVLLVH